MDSFKSDGTSADDAKIKSDLFNLVEKLRIELPKKDQQLQQKDDELQGKDEELAKEKQKKKKLSADLVKGKARANRAITELATAQQINRVLQISLWKSFPSPELLYHIKTQSGLQNGQFPYLYVPGYLRLLGDDQSRGTFKFIKNSDGTFFIGSMEKYLKTKSSRVCFVKNNGNAEKFVLFFHEQNKQTGLLVDISTLAGYFLLLDNNNKLVANSRTPPADKFLIIPVDVE